MTLTNQAIQVDTRPMELKNVRSLVFGVFDQIDVGVSMELLSNEDPVMLRSQFEMKKSNQFAWKYLESGPRIWRVVITKIKEKPGAAQCCGACGG